MKHPTYADTGEPVFIGDNAFSVVGQSIEYVTVLELGDDPWLYLGVDEPERPTFYKHRHNAIAAWEKLLEESK